MEAEGNRLCTKLQEYKERQRAAQEKMKKALQYINNDHNTHDADRRWTKLCNPWSKMEE